MNRKDFQYYQAGLRDAVAFLHKRADMAPNAYARRTVDIAAMALGTHRKGLLPPDLTQARKSEAPTND